MKFAASTFIWGAGFGRAHFDILPRIKAQGFDGVEIPLVDPRDFPAGEVRRRCDENALTPAVCSAFFGDISLISDDLVVRRRSIRHLRACVEATAEAGAKVLAGPLYLPRAVSHGRRRTVDEWKRAIEGYWSVTSALEGVGVNLAIEPLTRWETFFLNTAGEAAALAAAVGHRRVGVLFDTSHACLEEASLSEGLLAASPHLKHVHACEHDLGTPGSGRVPWRDALQGLSNLGYNGWLTVASLGLGQNGSTDCVERRREAFLTPESIAFDGIKFLKALLSVSWSDRSREIVAAG